ncbi:MAG: DUF5678 domain-containing protein [bacterium]|nr:DUF5678 domain-containing protein [bacterium]
MALTSVRTEELTLQDIRNFKEDEEDFDWFAEHSKEIEKKYKGKYVAVANKELFVAESLENVEKAVKFKYPDRQPFIELGAVTLRY